jgi:hypothetical protein
MPRVIVSANPHGQLDAAVTLSERVTLADFESEHFSAHLIERLRWAVCDAHDRERARTEALARGSEPERAPGVDVREPRGLAAAAGARAWAL